MTKDEDLKSCSANAKRKSLESDVTSETWHRKLCCSVFHYFPTIYPIVLAVNVLDRLQWNFRFPSFVPHPHTVRGGHAVSDAHLFVIELRKSQSFGIHRSHTLKKRNYSSFWYHGTFRYGTFRHKTFRNGSFRNGSFRHGAFRHGSRRSWFFASLCVRVTNLGRDALFDTTPSFVAFVGIGALFAVSTGDWI